MPEASTFGKKDLTMADPLSADALVEQAMKNTGIDAFDCDSYREGLEVFLAGRTAALSSLETRPTSYPSW